MSDLNDWADSGFCGLLGAVNALDIDATCALSERDRLAAWANLEEANRVLQQVRSVLVYRVAESMSAHQVTVEGVGTFIRHVKRDRTEWNKDDLLRAVLDSRLAHSHTGEIADETPLAKVLHVWNLPAPRITALRARGIEAEMFCRTERGGWTIERI